MYKSKDTSSLLAQLNKCLPSSFSPEGNSHAQQLFDLIDNNHNGYASLAEIDKGLKFIIKIPELKAYNKARLVKKSSNKTQNDYVTRDQFIYMLIYLRMYYEFYMEFTLLDNNHDSSISLQELDKGKHTLEKWKIDTSNLVGLFKEIDQDGRGSISFREFSTWAVNKSFKNQFGVPEHLE